MAKRASECPVKQESTLLDTPTQDTILYTVPEDDDVQFITPPPKRRIVHDLTQEFDDVADPPSLTIVGGSAPQTPLESQLLLDDNEPWTDDECCSQQSYDSYPDRDTIPLVMPDAEFFEPPNFKVSDYDNAPIPESDEYITVYRFVDWFADNETIRQADVREGWKAFEVFFRRLAKGKPCNFMRKFDMRTGLSSFEQYMRSYVVIKL